MKRLLLMALAIIGFSTVNAQNYVDLGLPSGTLWNSENEDLDFHGNAIWKYCNDKTCLPTMRQWQELIDNCSWTWVGTGYSVYGPNGNRIFLHAEGFSLSNGEKNGEGFRGSYWGFDGEDYNQDGVPARVYTLNFDANDVVILCGPTREYGRSVRLVRVRNN